MKFNYFLLAAILIRIPYGLSVLLNEDMERFYRSRPIDGFPMVSNEMVFKYFYKNSEPRDQPEHLLDIIRLDNSPICFEVFGLFNGLEDLKLNGASVMTILPETFKELTTLLNLSLRNNTIRNLPDRGFAHLRNLITLDLSDNRIEKIEDSAFENLSNLQKLNMSHNLITKLQKKVFKDLKQLQTLNLSFNKLTQLDNNIFKNLQNLVHLSLSHNQLRQFNESISEKTKEAFNSFLTKLMEKPLLPPFEVFQIYNKLNPPKSMIRGYLKLLTRKWKLPDEDFLFNTEKDYSYYFSDTDNVFRNLMTFARKHLPNHDTNYSAITSRLNNITLSKTRLPYTNRLLMKKVSNNFSNSSLTLNYLQSLQYLDISNNNLTIISYDLLGGLKSLIHLKLQHNQISVIFPDSIQNLESLQDIDLSHNKLTDLEVGVFRKLENLVTLNISHNSLITLNNAIFHGLKNLDTLSIAYNNISSGVVENALTYLLLENIKPQENSSETPSKAVDCSYTDQKRRLLDDVLKILEETEGKMEFFLNFCIIFLVILGFLNCFWFWYQTTKPFDLKPHRIEKNGTPPVQNGIIH